MIIADTSSESNATPSPSGSYRVLSGKPSGPGVTPTKRGLNFSIFSSHATKMTLYLFDPKTGEPLADFSLDPKKNRTGRMWHIHITGLPEGIRYSFRADGPHNPSKGLYFSAEADLLDPFAHAVDSHTEWGKREGPYRPRGIVVPDEPFDWQGDAPLGLPMKDLVLYEMHIRGFTADSSSGVTGPGTFLGAIEKIPYLKRLGVNAVELLPIFEFDESDCFAKGPDGEFLVNYWGYSTLNFFTPMTRYASSVEGQPQSLQAIREFKTMVREFHKAGIEVILDVVYNHTGEHLVHGPSISYRGLAPNVYYMMNSKGEPLNYSGCGNTFNCNHVAVRKLIMNSLRYWVGEMHVDGFRFDLGSILSRDSKGHPLANPPIIESISEDPVLMGTKLISESWDAAGLYQVGHFPTWGEWSEWNGQYRDMVRRFIKGCDDEAGHFAKCLSGSPHLYHPHGTPYSSINFLTAHDGYSLRDLVSYNDKHNLANGEENRDGMNENESWNCGAEGPTDDPEVTALRQRQMRNFHLALILSQGVPMVSMGDEYGHTKEGNNNTWCQDNRLNWFVWEEKEHDREFLRFFSGMIHFRHRHPILRQEDFVGHDRMQWHGHRPFHPDWSNESRFVAFTLRNPENNEDLYAAFNAHFHHADVIFPPPPEGCQWHRIVDTNLPSPNDFCIESEAPRVTSEKHDMAPHSAILLKAMRT